MNKMTDSKGEWQGFVEQCNVEELYIFDDDGEVNSYIISVNYLYIAHYRFCKKYLFYMVL